MHRRWRGVGRDRFVSRPIFLISDDSGCWGQGGLFSALSRRSLQPESRYELAGKMKGILVTVYFVVCFQNYSMAFLDDCNMYFLLLLCLLISEKARGWIQQPIVWTLCFWRQWISTGAILVGPGMHNSVNKIYIKEIILIKKSPSIGSMIKISYHTIFRSSNSLSSHLLDTSVWVLAILPPGFIF